MLINIIFSFSQNAINPSPTNAIIYDLTLYFIIILTRQQQTAFENIVGKGEIANNKQFSFSHNAFFSIR